MSHRSRFLAASAILWFALGGNQVALAGNACMAKSERLMTPVVELYTSEGCSSCPPADRWLSASRDDPKLVGLAFHVDYWDRLGWKDRFATAAFTARQSAEQKHNGARFSYTPQVVINGSDRPDWPQAHAGALDAKSRISTVDVTLQRDGSHVSATVLPAAAAPRRLAAYWAVTEQGHVSAVKAGENQGVTLRHDFVVRDYRPVAAWPVTMGRPETLGFDINNAGDEAHARAINLVVIDADSGKPVQALKLGC